MYTDAWCLIISHVVSFVVYKQSFYVFAAADVLARVVMKDVANYDTHCELRSFGNQQDFERMRHIG